MKTILSLTLFISSFASFGQDAVDEIMYQAYLSQAPSSEQWKSAVATRKAEAGRDGSVQAKFRLATAQFGLLSSTMRTQDEDLFDEYYKDTEKLLESIISQDKSHGEAHALLSATYGLKMGYSPMQGMFLGSKSNNLTEKAKKLAPTSPLVWKVYANSKYFTPEMWGGDLSLAIDAYETCIKHYEANPASLKFNWMYLDALAFQGQAYLKNGDTGKAIQAFEKALKVEPEFGWVRGVLLPKAKAQAGK